MCVGSAVPVGAGDGVAEGSEVGVTVISGVAVGVAVGVSVTVATVSGAGIAVGVGAGAELGGCASTGSEVTDGTAVATGVARTVVATAGAACSPPQAARAMTVSGTATAPLLPSTFRSACPRTLPWRHSPHPAQWRQ